MSDFSDICRVARSMFTKLIIFGALLWVGLNTHISGSADFTVSFNQDAVPKVVGSTILPDSVKRKPEVRQ